MTAYFIRICFIHLSTKAGQYLAAHWHNDPLKALIDTKIKHIFEIRKWRFKYSFHCREAAMHSTATASQHQND
jgi:hypothetical protein